MSIRALEIEEVVTSELFTGPEAPPDELAHLLEAITKAAEGTGILSKSDKEEIARAAEKFPGEQNFFFSLIRLQHAVDTSGERRRLGALPPIFELMDILKRAVMCGVKGISEAHWNCVVHYPLLNIALRWASVNQNASDNQGEIDQSEVTIEVHNVMTAQIAQEYISAASTKQDKRVDFCLVIRPQLNKELMSLKRLAGLVRHQNIKHITYLPLMELPISSSIETKRVDGSWTEAEHQLSTWQAAHHVRLGDFLRPALSPTYPPLPGLVVIGHQWFFCRHHAGSRT